MPYYPEFKTAVDIDYINSRGSPILFFSYNKRFYLYRTYFIVNLGALVVKHFTSLLNVIGFNKRSTTPCNRNLIFE